MEAKLTHKLNDLAAALTNFQDSLTLDLMLFPELVADNLKSGQIQKFEFTVELLWKAAKIFLYEIEGIDALTPKSTAKDFFQAGYCSVEDYEQFITAINDRNLLSHVYRQEMAESVRMRLPGHLRAMQQIEKAMREKLAGFSV